MRSSWTLLRIGLVVLLGLLIPIAIVLGIRKSDPGDVIFDQDDPQVTPPATTLRVPPKYPEAARRAGKEATVLVSAVVGRDGAVRDVAPAGMAQTGFEQPAAEAVRNWRFRPGMRDGQPVSVRCQFPVEFRLTRVIADGLTGSVFRVDDPNVTAPSPISRVLPLPGAARALPDKRELLVEVELIVDRNGAPQRVRVPRPVGFGIDEQAIAAVKQWRFTPGLKGDVPVNVATAVNVRFTP